jgi:Peptidase family M28
VPPIRFALLLLFAIGAGAAPAASVPSGSPQIEIDPLRLKAHMDVLADDLLEGREAGTRGDALAQLYIRTRFEEIGLGAAGDSGSYLQRFRVRATTLDPDSVDFRIGPRGFANGEDVAVFGDPLETEQQVEGAVVFAGYGIVAPEHDIDDYSGLDVAGKVVALLGGPPAFLPAAEAAHYGSTEQQRLTAEAKGAIGVIILWTPALEQRFAFDGLKALLGRTDLNWLGPDGRPHVLAPKIRLRAFVRGKAADALFEASPRRLAAVLGETRNRSPKGFDGSTISLARRSRHDDRLVSANVAGLLPGSDPRLRDELVVLTAHYDHVGIGAPVDGDSIYNGALDNAVGTAMLIEVARSLAHGPARPRRPVLFLAVGAEEKGLIGSDYFAAHPSVPGGSLVANINLDGAMPFYDFSDVIAFGAEQSQMGERLAAAAGQLGLAVAPDPFPEEGIFTRSDQYSFVKRGVPALFLYMGFTDMSGRNVGRRLWDELNETVVHRPGDDLSQPIDYRMAAKFAELFRRVTIETANAEHRPLWYRDSIFRRFAPAAATADRPRSAR